MGMLCNVLFCDIHKLLVIRWITIDRVNSFIKNSMLICFHSSSCSIFKYYVSICGREFKEGTDDSVVVIKFVTSIMGVFDYDV